MTIFSLFALINGAADEISFRKNSVVDTASGDQKGEWKMIANSSSTSVGDDLFCHFPLLEKQFHCCGRAERVSERESMKNAGRSAFWTFIEFIRRWRAEKDEVVYRRFISKTKGKTLEERKINWFFRLIILIHSMATNESEQTIHLKALERWFTCSAAMRNLFTFPSFSSIMLSATTAKKAKKNLAPAKTTAMTRNLFLWII
jgi:hypothetical protein